MANYPPEIWLLIYSHLCHSDLKSVSQCSKYLRRLALPAVFRAIQFLPGTSSAFENGTFDSLAHSIRKVTLGVLTDTPLNSVLDLLRSSSRTLRLLPNLKDLRIYLTTISELQASVFLAVFRALSSYPFYKNLESLTLNFTTSLDFSSHNQILSSLSPENRDFLEHRVSSCPPNLERLSISGMNNLYFDLVAEVMPNPCILLYSTSQTLKKVKFEANLINSTMRGLKQLKNGSLATYNSVAEVWFVQDTLQSSLNAVYAEICCRFPNTQYLRVDYGKSNFYYRPSTAGTMLETLAGLQKLKKALLPWPLSSYRLHADPSDLHRDLRIRLHNPEFRLLEYIDFVSQECYSCEGRVCRIKVEGSHSRGYLRRQRFYTWGDIGF